MGDLGNEWPMIVSYFVILSHIWSLLENIKNMIVILWAIIFVLF